MKTQEATIQALNGDRFSAYLAMPDSGSGPGLIVIQEIFGVNEVMRQTANLYAEAGYIAVVPDLFWRQEPGIQLSGKDQGEWNQAFELYRGFNEDSGIDDLIATFDFLKQYPGCTGKVGSLGFCLGGKLAYLMATRSQTDCNVGYYGVGIEKNLPEAVHIHRPLMLHIAENDQFVPPEAWSLVEAELSQHSWVTVHTYPGVNHGFARIAGSDFSAAAAEPANKRTLAFFSRYLG